MYGLTSIASTEHYGQQLPHVHARFRKHLKLLDMTGHAQYIVISYSWLDEALVTKRLPRTDGAACGPFSHVPRFRQREVRRPLHPAASQRFPCSKRNKPGFPPNVQLACFPLKAVVEGRSRCQQPSNSALVSIAARW